MKGTATDAACPGLSPRIRRPTSLRPCAAAAPPVPPPAAAPLRSAPEQDIRGLGSPRSAAGSPPPLSRRSGPPAGQRGCRLHRPEVPTTSITEHSRAAVKAARAHAREEPRRTRPHPAGGVHHISQQSGGTVTTPCLVIPILEHFAIIETAHPGDISVQLQNHRLPARRCRLSTFCVISSMAGTRSCSRPGRSDRDWAGRAGHFPAPGVPVPDQLGSERNPSTVASCSGLYCSQKPAPLPRGKSGSRSRGSLRRPWRPPAAGPRQSSRPPFSGLHPTRSFHRIPESQTVIGAGMNVTARISMQNTPIARRRGSRGISSSSTGGCFTGSGAGSATPRKTIPSRKCRSPGATGRRQ